MVNKSLSYFPSKCETSPAFQSDTPICKTNVNYFIPQKSKSKQLSAYLYYVFPLHHNNNHVSVNNGLYLLKKFLATEWYKAVTECQIQIDINNFIIRDVNEVSRRWELETKRILCAVECNLIHDDKELIAVVIKNNDHDDGFILYIGLDNDAFGICKIINNYAEKAIDNFVIKIHSSNEITIDSKILKYHIDILNSIIKEIIDMAIVVARFVETRKKLEKKSKGYKIQRSKEVSFKLVASAPTTDEFVDLLKKVRVALNMMARLNPFVTNPNIPELLHHMIAPFSLITSVCGHQLVKSVKKPFLTVKAIWLVEHCFTTNELAFWRTLGEGWNKPCKIYDIEDLHDLDFKPKLKYFQECLIGEFKNPQNFQSEDSIPMKNESNVGVVIQYHQPKHKSEIFAYPGTYVYVIDELDELYNIVDICNNKGWIPKTKVSCFGRHHKFNTFNQYIKNFIDENYSLHIKPETASESQTEEHKQANISTSNHEEEKKDVSEVKEIDIEVTKEENNGCQQSQNYENVPQNLEVINDVTTTNVTKSTNSIRSKLSKKSLKECETEKSNSKSKQSLVTSSSCELTEKVSQSETSTKKKTVTKKNEKKNKRFCGWCCIRKSTMSSDASFILQSSRSETVSSTTLSSQPETKNAEIKVVEQNPLEKIEDSTHESINKCQSSVQLSMDVDRCKVSESHLKSELNDHKILNNKEISLSWKKTEAPETDCIKIEGMKLFKVRIKMVDTSENSQDISQRVGKTTLLLQNHSNIDLKPNSKIFIHHDEATNDILFDEKSINSKETSSGSLKFSNIIEDKVELIQKKSLESGQKHIIPLKISKRPVERKLRKIHESEASQSITANVSQTKIETPKPIIVEQKKICLEQEKVYQQKDISPSEIDTHNTSNKIVNILNKFVPNIIATVSKAKEDSDNNRKVQDSIDEFYDQHVCKDCGGVCDEETNPQENEDLLTKSEIKSADFISAPEQKYIPETIELDEITQPISSYIASIESKIGSFDIEYIRNAMKWSSNEESLENSGNNEAIKNLKVNTEPESTLSDIKIHTLEVSDIKTETNHSNIDSVPSEKEESKILSFTETYRVNTINDPKMLNVPANTPEITPNNESELIPNVDGDEVIPINIPNEEVESSNIEIEHSLATNEGTDATINASLRTFEGGDSDDNYDNRGFSETIEERSIDSSNLDPKLNATENLSNIATTNNIYPPILNLTSENLPNTPETEENIQGQPIEIRLTTTSDSNINTITNIDSNEDSRSLEAN